MTPDWAARPTAVPYALFGDPHRSTCILTCETTRLPVRTRTDIVEAGQVILSVPVNRRVRKMKRNRERIRRKIRAPSHLRRVRTPRRNLPFSRGLLRPIPRRASRHRPQFLAQRTLTGTRQTGNQSQGAGLFRGTDGLVTATFLRLMERVVSRRWCGMIPSPYAWRWARQGVFSTPRMKLVSGPPKETASTVKLRGILRLRLVFREAKDKSPLRMTD
jgi:hypothetical protein